MADATSHRSRILQSIRISLGQASSDSAIEAEYAAISRSYPRSGEHDDASLLELFEDRLKEYDSGVYRCEEAEIADAIASILDARKKAGLAVPGGLPAAWLPDWYVFRDASAYDAYQLDATEGILTGCTVAIAETGSIVLQNAEAQGARMLSLVPDYHLCVVFASQLVATVPDAFARLADTAELPTTFISGPSATADIEMTRIKGVHGPRFFDVLIVL